MFGGKEEGRLQSRRPRGDKRNILRNQSVFPKGIPLKNYSATIRLDTRGIPYCEAIGAAASGGGRVFCSGIFIVCRKTGARAAIFGGENAGLLLKRGGKMREGGWKIRRAGRLEEFY